MKMIIRQVMRLAYLTALQCGMRVRLGQSSYSYTGFFLNKMTTGDRHEGWLDAVYKAALRCKSGAFIDVGANRGQTLVKILTIDSNRQYIGFEPQLDCAFYLDQFIKRNGLERHTIVPLGLADDSKAVNLLKKKSSTDAAASIIPGFRPSNFYAAEEIIYVERGDDLLSGINPPAISTIKIDVEGGELEVIEGLSATLAQHSPFIFFEVLNHFLVATGQEIDQETIEFRERRLSALEAELHRHDYAIFNIVAGAGVNKVAKIAPEKSSDLSVTGYVAVPPVEHDQFLKYLEREQ